MRKNKKGLFYSVMLVIFALVILTIGLVAVLKKTNQEKKIGEEAAQIIEKYAEGEKVLFYIDQAAKYSVWNATYESGNHGVYFKKENSPCSYYEAKDGTYMLWEGVIKNDATQKEENKDCYPAKRDIVSNWNSFFNKKMDEYVKQYVYTTIPFNNYDFQFTEEKDLIRIKGIPTQKIIIPFNKLEYRERTIPTLSKEEQDCIATKDAYPYLKKGKYQKCDSCDQNVKCEYYSTEQLCKIDACNKGCSWKKDKCIPDTTTYAVNPFFKTELPYNFIDGFTKYTNSIKQIRDKIQSCLAIGSGQPGDDDLETCSNINNFKDIENIDNYGIKPITSDKYLTLLFDIDDYSLKNPYSKDKLNVRFGIKFLDTFKPVFTEASTETKEGEKYIVWKENNSSDVIEYKIYSKKATTLEDIKEIASVEKGKTEWKIEGLEQGTYYFYIIAQDKAGNLADINQAETKKLDVTI